jgi:nitrite reductase/ring-hydroxylating ferredoxin subunit
MNKETLCEDTEKSCGGRREFLVKASAIAGGLALTLSGLNQVNAQQTMSDEMKKKDDKDKKKVQDELTVKLDDKSPLNKVGGSDTFKTDSGKVIVVRMSETSFKAFNAKCPHKGGPIKYDEKNKQFTCGWHESLFDTNGKVTHAPANTDLQPFTTQSAVVISLKVA